MENLHSDLESNQNRIKDALIKSYKFAKSYYVKNGSKYVKK